MNIEDRIRSRIESILINDARNDAELQKIAAEGDLKEVDYFESERNLYQRIINNYRNAVREVNHLLEENVGFLSAFYRIVESIKEKSNFQEICSRIVDCVLQDFGAEYCSLVFPQDSGTDEDAFYLEGVREERKFLRVHSNSSLLGSIEFEAVLAGIVARSSDCLHIEDVYRDSRFNKVDFPSVVRSLVCLPISLWQKPVGMLLLSHSLPNFFTVNHLRVLKILASTISHLRLLSEGCEALPSGRLHDEGPPVDASDPDVFSIILLDIKPGEEFGRRKSVEKEVVREIRSRLSEGLGPRESILFHNDRDLIVLLPGIKAEQLDERVCRLRASFRQWRASQRKELRSLQMNVGYSTCEQGDDLSRALETASLVMHSEADEEFRMAAEM